MKARSREVVEYQEFNAPEPAALTGRQEQHEIEGRYNVRLLPMAVLGTNSLRSQWVYGRAADPARSVINPGDYIVTDRAGTRIVPGAAFLAAYEPID